MTRLVPCRECQRHVRVGGSCPFCGAEPPPVTDIVRPRAPGRFAMLFAGSVVLSACGEQVNQDLAPAPSESHSTPAAATAPTEGVEPDERGTPEATDAPAELAQPEAADAPSEGAQPRAAEEASEVEAPAATPPTRGQAQAVRERTRANAPAETADEAASGPAEPEDLGAVAAYGGPSLRVRPIPETERVVPLYGGPSLQIDDDR